MGDTQRGTTTTTSNARESGPRDPLGLLMTRDSRGPPSVGAAHDRVDGPQVTARAVRVLRWLRRGLRRSPGVARPPRVAPADLGSAGCSVLPVRRRWGAS